MEPSLAYAVGSLGVVVEWRAYLLTSGKAFRCWSALGSLLWAVMYGLLGAWTASAIMVCTALRTLLSVWLIARRYKHAAFLGFVLLFLAFTLLSWQGPISLLPALAVINTTFALFYLPNRTMRKFLLLSSAFWMTNDIFWEAWPSLLAESVAALLNLYTLYRLSQSAT